MGATAALGRLWPEVLKNTVGTGLTVAPESTPFE